MSFWNLSDNTQATATGGTFETGGGNMDPIPAGTQLSAMIEEAVWDEYEGNKFIKIKWRVIDGEYKKRVIFHKIHVFGNPTAKDVAANADKAKRMLAAIDANAGGQLSQLTEAPTDMDLAKALANKMMTIQVQVWEMDTAEGPRSGNWVNAVAPRGQMQKHEAKPKPAPKPEKVSASPADVQMFDEGQTLNSNMDSDIPF